MIIADDHPQFLAGMLRAIGRRSDIDLLAFEHDGAAALATTRHLRPELLVVDDRMPGMTGPEIASVVGLDPSLRGVRVVVLSANSDRELVERCSLAGVHHLIDKALSRADICSALVAFAADPRAA